MAMSFVLLILVTNFTDHYHVSNLLRDLSFWFQINNRGTELLQNAVVIFVNIIKHDRIKKAWSYFNEPRVTGFN